VGYCRSWLFYYSRGQPSYESQRRIEGLVLGFGTTRPVDGSGAKAEAIERELRALPVRGGDSEKERLVGSDE
jgi:hypothetical protein